MLQKFFPKNDWFDFLNEESKKEYFQHLNIFLQKEIENKTVYPPLQQIFKAFELTPLKTIKVVILGQDPYHQPHQAHGLAFSINDMFKQKQPPSLQNIFKEIKNDIGGQSRNVSGNLIPWAVQGVFLLNSFLTVVKNTPLSHSQIGWQFFTDNTIQFISQKTQNVNFVLWGKSAQEKENLIDSQKHHILKSSHPSPFSANKGFLGSKHFSQINTYLKSHDKPIIQWIN